MLTSHLAGQSLPQPLKEWKLDYSVSGGMAGNIHSLTLTHEGKVTALDTKLGYHFEGRISDDLLAKFAAYLKVAHVLKSNANGSAIPDGISTSLVVTSGGRKYPIKSSPESGALLRETFDASVKQAVLETWWQSAWKLCNPAGRMSEIDPPIDELVFNPDGTFSVTWRGGGARTTGIPHVFIPDYRGHYTIAPGTGSISMQMDSGGVFVPKDFAGEGRFRINMGQLTLQNVWFGTKQAKQKPDICELTFSKK
jgi:hypothetical protein